MTERRSAAAPFSGYHKREVPREDERLTHTGAGTPCGELMRRYWQPVALAGELGEVPLAIDILGEELVGFRDGGGRVGVLHRHRLLGGGPLSAAPVQHVRLRQLDFRGKLPSVTAPP